jgi:hypothetical protein
MPHGVTLIGRVFEEDTLEGARIALEKAFGVAGERPKGFWRWWLVAQSLSPAGVGCAPKTNAAELMVCATIALFSYKYNKISNIDKC